MGGRPGVGGWIGFGEAEREREYGGGLGRMWVCEQLQYVCVCAFYLEKYGS